MGVVNYACELLVANDASLKKETGERSAKFVIFKKGGQEVQKNDRGYFKEIRDHEDS